MSNAIDWPKHPDGRNMKIGEMTAEVRHRVGAAAIKQVMGEPQMQHAIATVLALPEPPPPREAIRLAPTWSGIVPLLIAALEHGTDKARDAAKAELREMARAADLYNALQGGG